MRQHFRVNVSYPSIGYSKGWNMAPDQNDTFYHLSLFYLSWEPTREPCSATPLNDPEWLLGYRWILIWAWQTAQQGYRLLHYCEDLSSDPQNSHIGCLNSGTSSCNSHVPTVRWRAEAGESPETCELAWYTQLLTTKKPVSNMMKSAMSRLSHTCSVIHVQTQVRHFTHE